MTPLNVLLWTLITLGATTVCTLLVTKIAKVIKTIWRHHCEVEVLPAIFKKHEEVHTEIKLQLDLAEEQDIEVNQKLKLAQEIYVVQMRNQILSIHDRAMDNGFITSHWARQFYDLVDMYVLIGGNSFVDKLIANINEMTKEMRY